MTPSPIDSAVGIIKLGGTLTIPRLGFGAMQLPGRPDGPAVDQATAVTVARRAVELGVRHLGTAAFYFCGTNRANDILRKALHPYPADLTIATKVGPLRTPTGKMFGEAGPDQLRPAVEQNLQELAVDTLDLVYLRVGRLAAAGTDPIGDRFTTLAELRDEGLIRHLGVSNVTREQLAEARAIAPVAAVQNRFACSISGTLRWSTSARTPASPSCRSSRLAAATPRSPARAFTRSPSGMVRPCSRWRSPGGWHALLRSCRSPVPPR
jgi:pyridoxine 4-dehydrogenase